VTRYIKYRLAWSSIWLMAASAGFGQSGGQSNPPVPPPPAGQDRPVVAPPSPRKPSEPAGTPGLISRSPAANGRRRLALVVGNQSYPRKPLRNSLADAQAVEALLRGDLAFEEVRRVEDTTLLQLQRAVREFVRQVRPGDLALFYYSGHGMQVGGINWMIPVDFHAEFEDDVPDQAFPAQRLLKELEDAGAAVRIMILDACRDNPLPAAGRRSGKDGLAPMSGTEGTYVLFSTGENRLADDNPRGANSLFTSYLIEAMRKPGLTLEDAFKETRRAVAEASGGRQRPWLATDIDQDLVLLPAASPQTQRGTDAAAWELVRDSTDTNSIEAFLAQYPSSEYAGAARLRLAALRSSEPPSGSPKEPSPAAAVKPGPSKVNPKDGLEYVWIPPGRFRMGCSKDDNDCAANEKPAHDVELTRGFWLGKTEVTQGAYESVMGNNPSAYQRANLPVNQVTWAEAQAYCGKIGGRLPTEAEWEYAARAGSTASRYGELDAIAWYRDNTGKGQPNLAGVAENDWDIYWGRINENGNRPQQVGTKAPNGFGLYDMLGNVWEWVVDVPGPYAAGAVRDPQHTGSGTSRILRGGSWGNSASDARASRRMTRQSGKGGYSIGFRCVGQ
jgi:formylglycine-generating enzyme required for sulfatase activity